MQLYRKITLSMAMLACLAMVTLPALAEDKPSAKTTSKTKTYSEDEFITAFQGKSRKVITEKLGMPVKKEQSVKPTGSDAVLASKVKAEETSKPVNVEMWYYKNIVRYDPKRTYKETELTFVNDRLMNIAFFNNR
jgi:hypothetical protein